MSEKMDNINPAIIKKTQDTLGRLIQAPSLTDKLLNRPPVQFIQDIVKSVVKNTGLMKGLYSAEELEGAYIKASKENKLIFLKKLITFVSLVIGDHLSVKEGKIAAGSEAEKTNELLQCLAKAINMKPDNDDFVKKTLKKLKSQSDEPEKEKEKGGRGSREDKRDDKPEKEEKRDRERDKSKDERHKDRDREEKHKDREESKHSKDREDRHKEKEREKEREEKSAKDRSVSKDKDEKRERRKKDEEKERERDSSRHSREKKDSEGNDDKVRRHSSSRGKRADENDESDSKHKKESASRSSSKKEEEKRNNRTEDNEEDEMSSKKSRRGRDNREEEQNGDNDDNEDEKIEQTRLRRPSSAKGGRKVATDEMALQAAQGNLNNNNNDDMRNVPRPTTARPGAPRKRLTNETEDVTPNSKVVAQSSVIVDKDSESDDDFVVKEQKLQDDQKLPLNGFGGDAGDDDDLDKNGLNKGEHGALVKKILESKEQLEHGSQLNNKKNDSQKPTMQMDAQRKKERERIQKEIDKLKESIQTLTKSSIPLGRTLDFLQEDIDMMQNELGKWRDEYDLHSKALKRQQQEANLALEPYKAALNEVNNSINDQLEKIASVKRKILLNEDKISKLIFNIGKRN